MNNQVRMNVPYFQVPNNIFDADELKDYEKLVYIYLCRCGNNGGQAFPSYNTIAKKCSISKRSAMRAVNRLIELNLVRKEIRPKDNRDNETNIYVVYLPSDSQSPPPSDSQTLPSDTESSNKELLYKESISEKEQPLYIVPNNDVFIDFYLRAFKHYFNADHVRVSRENLIYIQRTIEIFHDRDIELDEWQEKVVEHLENLPDSNNGSIVAFLKASFRYFEIDPERAIG